MIRMLAMLGIAIAALAQTRPSLMEDVGKTNLPTQRLGADDLVAISVYDAPELTRTIRVDADGSVHLPLLKKGVQAEGLMPSDLEKAIAQALKTEQILVDPIVKVTVAEYHSRPISVMGAVRKPLTFQAVGAVTLLDALARAEGLTQDAGAEIVVSQGERHLLQRISVKQLIDAADPAMNLRLTGGEEIRVPEAGKIFVMGNVQKPGAFIVREAAESSVLRMVALAGGMMPYAAKQAYVYRKDPATGAKNEVTIEHEKIMERKAPDVPLHIDDILYVPDNKSRRNAMTVIDRITTFGASTASGVLVWRR
ncbi:MAG: polysaccharide biosynthesis/export family protein [Bryobacteraceae bacterium]